MSELVSADSPQDPLCSLQRIFRVPAVCY